MAIAIPEAITPPNTIGGISSPVVAVASGNFTSFTSNASSSSVLLKAVTIISLNQDVFQLSQPFSLDHLDLEGNIVSTLFTPFVNPYQFTAQVKRISVEFEFNGLSSLNYIIYPGQSVLVLLSLDIKDSYDRRIRKTFKYIPDNSWENNVNKYLFTPREYKELQTIPTQFDDIIIKEKREAEEERHRPKYLRGDTSTPISDFFYEPGEYTPKTAFDEIYAISMSEPNEIDLNLHDNNLNNFTTNDLKEPEEY